MNLQESIRRILKEETDSVKNLNESKTSQHLKLMNNLLDPLKKKDCLCDIKISFDVEENYYNIYLVFNQKELYEKFFDLYGRKTYIQKMKEEVKMELESFLPIRNIFIGYYTKPNCEWSPLNESEDDKEKKIQKNLRAIKELINMVDYSEVCDMWVEYDPEDGYYAIRSKMSTKNHNTKALEKEFRFLEDSIKSLGLKAYISHPYWVEECEDKNELNESEDDKEKKIQKNLRVIRQLLDTIDIEGLCEIGVEYNPEDGDYEIRSKTTIRYYDMADMTQELEYIEDTIRSWGLRTYVFTPRYVENCEDERGIEFLNESKQERKFTKLLNNIEEYLNSNSYNSVVRFMVDYDEVMDDVIVNIFIDAEDAVKLGGGINSVIKKTGKKIMEDLSLFPFDFKYHIHFERPQLNESENKKSALLRAIEEDGLFQIIQDTGLSMGQIILKYDNLPREVFERYIKDFIRYDGYHQTDGAVQMGYEVEISHNLYVNHFYMKGDKVTVETRRYNDYNEQTEGYIESLSNLTDEEIFSIVDDMTRNMEDNWD